jgi:hypothetical protein
MSQIENLSRRQPMDSGTGADAAAYPRMQRSRRCDAVGAVQDGRLKRLQSSPSN